MQAQRTSCKLVIFTEINKNIAKSESTNAAYTYQLPWTVLVRRSPFKHALEDGPYSKEYRVLQAALPSSSVLCYYQLYQWAPWTSGEYHKVIVVQLTNLGKVKFCKKRLRLVFCDHCIGPVTFDLRAPQRDHVVKEKNIHLTLLWRETPAKFYLSICPIPPKPSWS